MAKANEIKYLTAIKAEKRPKKYCRFKKMGIRYIDYKDGDFLEEIPERTGKTATTPHYREFIEVPA